MSIMGRFTIAMVLIFGVGSGHARSLNIVVVGASNTVGWGVGAANAFPARLQTILKERGIDAKVTSAGVIGDTTGGMLRRIDTAVPDNTNIVILQPGTNDLRFFGSKQQRAANISAIVDRLRRRHIRVIVLDPVIPTRFVAMGRDPLYRCSAFQIRDDTGGANFGWTKGRNETVIGSTGRVLTMGTNASLCFGVKRTCRLQCEMSANNPKWTAQQLPGCDCPYAATVACRSQNRAVKKSKAPDPRQAGTATASNRSYPVAR